MRHETWKLLWVLILFSSLISCNTITIQPEKLGASFSSAPLSNTPDYEKSHHFFLGGLVGEAQVPVDKICKDKEVWQMQSQTTFLDGLWPSLIGIGAGVLGGFFIGALGADAVLSDDPTVFAADDPIMDDPTVFAAAIASTVLISSFASLIYAPKTAKVWCGESVDDGVDGAIKEGI